MNCQNHQQPDFDCLLSPFWGWVLVQEAQLLDPPSQNKRLKLNLFGVICLFSREEILYHKKHPDRNKDFCPEPSYELIPYKWHYEWVTGDVISPRIQWSYFLGPYFVSRCLGPPLKNCAKTLRFNLGAFFTSSGTSWASIEAKRNICGEVGVAISHVEKS